MKRIPFKIIFFAGALIIFSGLAFTRFIREKTAQKNCTEKNSGIFIAELGKDHIMPNAAHPPYNSNPPTSGWHTEETAKWGIHAASVSDEMQVHNLEHGGIVIQYAPEIDTNIRQRLEEITRRYASKVLLAPRARLDRNIALTAWTYLDKFDAFDECRIIGFIDAHINKGPEFTKD